MIIRVTVNDNDFYYVIMGFMKNMWKYWDTQKPVEKMNSDEIRKTCDEIHKHEDIMMLINPNYDKKLNEEEQNLIISYLKENFEKYINGLDKAETTKEYLIKHLEIKIRKSFTDKWENGEAFYWLQHSNKIINQ